MIGKYRGKAVNNTGWHCGDKWHDPFTNKTYIKTLIEGGTMLHDYEVHPESVSQHVHGLTDDKGAELYGGDLVRDEYKRLMLVQWCEDIKDHPRNHFARWEFKFIPTDENKTNNFKYADLGSWHRYDAKPGQLDVTIVGNSTDTPELLKEIDQ